MIDPERLTRETFLDELRARIDALRVSRVDLPPRIDASVVSIVDGPEDPFEQDLFRAAAAHLLNGLDPEIAYEDGGVDLLEDRLAALPVNLQLSLRVAGERHEQPV